MCMEDVRLGRSLAPIAFLKAVPQTVSTLLLPADDSRTRIVISTDGVNPFVLCCDGMNQNAGQGFALPNTSPRLEIRIEDWGRLVQGQWFAFGGGTDSTAAVMSASLEKR